MLYRCQDGDYLVHEWSPLPLYKIVLTEVSPTITKLEAYTKDILFPWKVHTIKTVKSFNACYLECGPLHLLNVQEWWDFNLSMFVHKFSHPLDPAYIVESPLTLLEEINTQKSIEL